ncbi:MAG: OsmC family protein [Gammaproteobacteria bacterium]
MNLSLVWLQDAAFAAENENNRRIIFDGPPEYGGKNAGMRPMEGLLSATAACSAFDVVRILKKSRQTLRGLKMEIKAERAETPPAVFTNIHFHFILDGELRPAATERAVQLSAEKYCSALAMLNKTAKISHSWEIQP